MIQQTARAISLEMALRDMIAAGHKAITTPPRS